MKTCKVSAFLFSALLLISANAFGQLSDQVDIHSFGSWGYGRTNNSNHFLIGTEKGNYNYFDLAISLTASPRDNLTIIIQPIWKQTEEGLETEIDYLFAQWTVSDGFKLRLGKAKHPFGIYTEFFEVGTLRPFFTLPTSIYGSIGITSEAYLGIGLTGTAYTKNGWGIQYDLYGGALQLDNYNPFEILNINSAAGGQENKLKNNMLINNTIGGKLTIFTTIEGLNFGFSAYSGDDQEIDGKKGDASHRHTAYGAHAEYLAYGFSLRSEIARLRESNENEVNAYYIEAAYRFHEHFQAAVTFNKSTSKLDNMNINNITSLLNHKEYAIGFNYWFSQNLVTKFSFHRVIGNRFAFDQASINEIIQTGELKQRTNLILAGMQFSF